jgi:hypothetical protein
VLALPVKRPQFTADDSVDLALTCDFDNREARAAYHRHAAHLETRAVVDPLIAEHWIADYEL